MGLGVLVAFFVRWYRAALAGEREDAAQMAKISDSIDDVSMAEARKEVLPLLSSNPFFYTEAAAGRQYLHPELPESIRELFSLYGAIIYLGVGIRSDWLPGPNENVQRIKIGEELDEDIVVVPGSDEVFVGPDDDDELVPGVDSDFTSIFNFLLRHYRLFGEPPNKQDADTLHP
jgi:hypothetical protein